MKYVLQTSTLINKVTFFHNKHEHHSVYSTNIMLCVNPSGANIVGRQPHTSARLVTLAQQLSARLIDSYDQKTIWVHLNVNNSKSIWDIAIIFGIQAEKHIMQQHNVLPNFLKKIGSPWEIENFILKKKFFPLTFRPFLHQEIAKISADTIAMKFR